MRVIVCECLFQIYIVIRNSSITRDCPNNICSRTRRLCGLCLLKMILNKSFRVIIKWNRFRTLLYNKSKISPRQFSKLSFLHASLATLQFKQISPIRNMNIQNSMRERKWSWWDGGSLKSLFSGLIWEEGEKYWNIFMNTSITLMTGDALWL